MWLRERVKAWRGEAFLSVLWVAGVMRRSPWLRHVYHSALARLVEQTGLFDPAHYLEVNGDVAEAGTSALRHYVAFGDKEGRSPMALFDPAFYRLQVPGRLKHVNALLHYVYVGWYHRKSPSPWFDVDFYLAANRDLVHTGVEPLGHYVTTGGLQGRSPSALFDGAYYLRANPDVLAASDNPLLHYLRYGHIEGRRPLPPAEERIEDAVADLPQPEPVSRDSFAELAPRAAVRDAAVDVIVPVYKGRIETLRCLRSALAAATDVPFELVVINDASPDQELAADLEWLAEKGLLSLHVNQTNRGFVHTVNRGMALHPERDVVLLNADAEVFDHWLDRLLSAAQRDPRTGTVTPLSNNATICSYPRFLHDNPYPLELGYPELDALTAAVNRGFEVEAPTAVGFCTYIKRACLDAVGLFDEKTFGKGYGEENDFCQRAIAKGWRNVIAGDVFVYHRGSTSFQGEKAKRVHVAMAILGKLYPAYHRDVAGFIERDELQTARHRLDWARLQRQSRERNVLIVVHGRGGGTERHVQDDIQVLTREGFGVYLLRPVPGNPTHVALTHPATKALPNLPPFAISDVQQLTGVLRELRITDVHTHSLIDAVPDAPKHVAELIKALGAKWEVNLHDYKVICPRINLADAAGRYCGEPEQPACNQCLAENDSLFGQPDIGEWREMHRHALLAADQVLVPDQDMAQRLQRYFPEVQFEVSPHEDIDAQGVELTVPRLGRDEPLHVVVVGAISYVKGFDVFLACAQDAQRRRLPLRFTLMGYSVNDGLLGKAGVQVTGRYLEHAALEQLRAIDPHVVWLPALWPETYSYTLSLALLLGRPIFAFDIGAIAARLRRLEMTDLLAPLALADAPEALNGLLLERRARWSAAND